MNSEMKADSLSDIMFFLMLFFLIMSTMIAPQVIKIKLPKADNAGKSVTKKNVILSVNADNKYFIDKIEVPLESLEPELSKMIKPGQELTETQVIAHCRERLAKFKCPSRVMFIEALPRNATGKVHKPTLRTSFLGNT